MCCDVMTTVVTDLIKKQLLLLVFEGHNYSISLLHQVILKELFFLHKIAFKKLESHMLTCLRSATS